ncbi:MAG: universal stress protein [Dehalococcoidales bacterium]
MEIRKILVPVVGTEADEEAMKLACRLAKRDKGKIWAFYVITIKRALPLDAEIKPEIEKAEGILDHIEMVAEEQDYEVETDVLQAREAGPAIIDEAVERKVDLILMGIKYKRRFGQFSLGNVVPYVLKNSPCPVILYQE